MTMITELDEAIKHCKEAAEENRKKADEWYAGGCSFAQAEGNDCLECVKEHEQLAECLTELKERREADRWIPVSERLPDKEGDYLVDRKERRLSIQHFFFSIADHSPYWSGDCKVYAWKPLPEPYESEVEND